jgi:uncharacterized membrane-anchored protein
MTIRRIGRPPSQVVLLSVVGTQLADALTDVLGVSLYFSTAVFAMALATRCRFFRELSTADETQRRACRVAPATVFHQANMVAAAAGNA